MLFQSKQVSCLWECWLTGMLPLWSDHRLRHAIKGEFLSVYKQVLTGNNQFRRLDEIHDLWQDPPLRHSFPGQTLPGHMFYKDKVLHIHVKWHKASWNYKLKYQGGCFSCRHIRVSHALSVLVRIWATPWSSEPGSQRVCCQETALTQWKCDVFMFTVNSFVFCDHL